MKISTKGLYGLHLMLDLLKEYETGFVSLRVAAARLDIPHKYLEQIAASLCRAQLLDSMRGPNGGYRLNKEPDDYRVGEVLRALEGDLLPTACLKNCPRRKQEALWCNSHYFWITYSEKINDFVDNKPLVSLQPPVSNIIESWQQASIE